jgi:hypothetical protein
MFSRNHHWIVNQMNFDHSCVGILWSFWIYLQYIYLLHEFIFIVFLPKPQIFSISAHCSNIKHVIGFIN